MKQSALFMLLYILFALFPARVHAEPLRISHTNPTFHAFLPEEFKEYPEFEDEKNILVFASGDPHDEIIDIFVVIEALEATVPMSDFDSVELAEGVTQKTVPWNGFILKQFRVPEKVDRLDYVNYNVIVPLAPRAIVVNMFTGVQRENEMQEIQTSFLDTLKGTTNWSIQNHYTKLLGDALKPPAPDPWTQLGKYLFFGVMLIAFPIILFLRILRRMLAPPPLSHQARQSQKAFASMDAVLGKLALDGLQLADDNEGASSVELYETLKTCFPLVENFHGECPISDQQKQIILTILTRFQAMIELGDPDIWMKEAIIHNKDWLDIRMLAREYCNAAA